jgi:lipoprotein-anchoring transpeptidase ErfK/SrfK
VIIVGSQTRGQSQRKPAAKRVQHKVSSKAAPRVNYDLATVNNPATMDQIGENAAGSAALRAEILLDRADFSVGEIDGHLGSNAVRAISGFRAARGLPLGNTIDGDAWKQLDQNADPVLIEATTTQSDVEGPFVKIPPTMMLQAKLMHLGYSSALEGIAERYHIQPPLLQQLNPGTNFNVAGQKFYAPNVRMQVSGKASKVVVSKSESVVKVLNDMRQVMAQYPCTTGSEHDPLPIGEWKVTVIFKNPTFHYNPDLFWDAKATDSKATIQPGPNNPVGVVWIDLSKEHYGIHGTPSPGKIGHTESHGCIRLTNWDVLELAGMVEKGTLVSFTE